MVRALMTLVAVASEFFLLLIPLIVVGAFAVIGVRRNRRDIKSQRREIAELRDALSATHREISARGKVEVELNEALRKAETALRGYIDYVNGRVEHLNFEFGKMACLPLNHPRRKALVDEVIVKMLPIQHQLDRVLFPGHEPLGDLDWMHKLKTKKFPYSLTDEEGLILYKLVTDAGLTNGYEIATAFGYSSFYLGLGFKKNGGRLVSVDAYVEETEENFIYDEETAKSRADMYTDLRRKGELHKLPEGLKFAILGAQQLGIDDVVRYEIGFSPVSVPGLLHGQKLDFAFIDGGHFGEQPCIDVDAVMPFMNLDKCIMMFHDTQCEAVAKGVHYAAQKIGGDVHSINTRNRLVVVSRNIDLRIIQGCREIIARQYC
jgi:hypothetical protein